MGGFIEGRQYNQSAYKLGVTGRSYHCSTERTLIFTLYQMEMYCYKTLRV